MQQQQQQQQQQLMTQRMMMNSANIQQPWSGDPSQVTDPSINSLDSSSNGYLTNR